MDIFDKKAKWISDGGHFIAESEEAGSPALYLEKSFGLKNFPEKAVVKICGLGLYELYINGARVGDRVLEPPFTEYDKRVAYSVYDVKKYLRTGQNRLLVILGDGWYNQTTRDTWGFYRAAWRDCPKLLFELDADGEKTVSDRSWSVSRGGIASNALRSGEYHDFTAKREVRPAAFTTPPGGELFCPDMPPMRECETLAPVSVERGNGCTIYDFGKNITGYVSAIFEGERGEKVYIEYSDRIKDGRCDNESNSMYLFNKGLRYQTDGCTLSGGTDFFKPRFVYHGFRYAAVYGKAAAKDIKAYFVHTDLERKGKFECSSAIVDKLYEMSINAVLCNYHGFPTDCPHREKNGWTGDAQLSLETCLHNFDMRGAYKKWLGDFIVNQRPSGQISAIVPSCGWGFNWGSGPAWDIAFFRIADALLSFYGDEETAAAVYPRLKKYYRYISSYLENGLLCVGLGDWNYPKNIKFSVCPTQLTDSCYYKLMSEILGKFAERFEPEAAAAYCAEAERTAAAIREKYSDEQSLTGLAALDFFGVADRGAEVFEYLEKNGCVLHAGILGTKFLFGVLARRKRSDLALRLLERTEYPSFGYWAEAGQTSLCEDFELTNSLNHHMYSCIAEYMCSGLCGLKLETPLKASLSPDLPSSMEFAETESHGFKVALRREKDKIRMDVTVPKAASLRYGRELFGEGKYVFEI